VNSHKRFNEQFGNSNTNPPTLNTLNDNQQSPNIRSRKQGSSLNAGQAPAQPSNFNLGIVERGATKMNHPMASSNNNSLILENQKEDQITPTTVVNRIK